MSEQKDDDHEEAQRIMSYVNKARKNGNSTYIEIEKRLLASGAIRQCMVETGMSRHRATLYMISLTSVIAKRTLEKRDTERPA
jgi:hypothetical protein